MIIATVFGISDERVIAAAFLHDVIEDSSVDYDDIAGSFGTEVADLCAAMSKDMRMVEPDREKAYDAQLAAASWKARLLKLADVYDNLSDAESEASRRKLIGKAERALALSKDDTQLQDAREALETLVRGMTPS